MPVKLRSFGKENLGPWMILHNEKSCKIQLYFIYKHKIHSYIFICIRTKGSRYPSESTFFVWVFHLVLPVFGCCSRRLQIAVSKRNFEKGQARGWPWPWASFFSHEK